MTIKNEKIVKAVFGECNEVTPLALANHWRCACKDGAVADRALEYLPEFIDTLPEGNEGKLIAVQTLGIPGAGKSTFVELLRSAFREHGMEFYKHNNDSIMERLPAYHADVKNIGAEEAFSKWELPTRVLGYSLLSAVIERKAPFIFDSCGVDEKQIQLLEYFQKQGYETCVVHLDVSLDTALQRVRDRQVDENSRYTPEHLVTSRQALLPDLLEKYSKVTRVICVDNNQFPDKQLVSSVVDGVLTSGASRRNFRPMLDTPEV